MQWKLRQCSAPLPRPSCKSCQKRAVSSRGRIAVLIILSRKLKRIKLRESVSITISRVSYNTFSCSPLRPLLSQISHVTGLFFLYRYISVLPPFFLPLFFFSNVLYPGEKISGTVRDRASMTINWPSKCTVKNIHDDTYLRLTTAMMRLDDRW